MMSAGVTNHPKTGSRADTGTAHMGTDTAPLGCSGYKRAKERMFWQAAGHFWFCSWCERYMEHTDSKEEQNTTWNLPRHKGGNGHLNWFYRGGFSVDQIQTTVLAGCSTASVTREQWDCMGVVGCQHFLQAGVCSQGLRGGMPHSVSLRYHEGKCPHLSRAAYFCWEHSPVQLPLVSRWAPQGCKLAQTFPLIPEESLTCSDCTK